MTELVWIAFAIILMVMLLVFLLGFFMGNDHSPRKDEKTTISGPDRISVCVKEKPTWRLDPTHCWECKEEWLAIKPPKKPPSMS